jgi:hypothetical protein
MEGAWQSHGNCDGVWRSGDQKKPLCIFLTSGPPPSPRPLRKKESLRLRLWLWSNAHEELVICGPGKVDRGLVVGRPCSGFDDTVSGDFVVLYAKGSERTPGCTVASGLCEGRGIGALWYEWKREIV